MILTQAEKGQLQIAVQDSINRLYQHDDLLFQREGMERSLAFRFALYLYEAIAQFGWLNGCDLDLEYNKNGNEPKRIPRRRFGVQPDIILHLRGSNERNVLVVEVKGWWIQGQHEEDIIKLEDFTHLDGEYGFGLGALLVINQNECHPVYYINGVRQE